MNARGFLYLSVVLILCFAVTLGCSKAPTDTQIATDIQNKINADSGLQGKQLVVQANNGSVTLSGTVDNDAERDAAARYASTEPGVKQVVNNLEVAPAAAATPQPAPQEQTAPQEESKHASSRRRHHAASEQSSAPTEVAQNTPPPPPTPAPAAVAPAAPPPPPPPQKVTIAQGTTLAVRLVDALDSETATQGQTFHATLDSPLAVDGDVAIPQGYDVEGHVVNVQSAGKFAGQSLLVLQLDRIKAGDKYYNIQTDQWKKQGSSRGKNTAEKVGAGAGVGALLGALLGGGKGAAIGAAAGGGLGGGVQAATKGQQIKLASETVLNFTLQAPVSVLPAGPPNGNRQRLSTGQ